MSKYCSDCEHLNIEKVKCDGYYFCKKKNDYQNACSDACPSFSKSYRKSSLKNEIYDLGKKNRKEDNISLSACVFSFILLIVLFIIAKIMGY